MPSIRPDCVADSVVEPLSRTNAQSGTTLYQPSSASTFPDLRFEGDNVMTEGPVLAWFDGKSQPLCCACVCHTMLTVMVDECGMHGCAF